MTNQPSATTPGDYALLAAVLVTLFLFFQALAGGFALEGTALDTGNKIAPERLVQVPASATERSV